MAGPRMVHCPHGVPCTRCTADLVHPAWHRWVMRAAFDTPEAPYLPKDVLWRQKEQFSDGVGYSWIDGVGQ